MPTREGYPVWSELDLRRSDEELSRLFPPEMTIKQAVEMLEMSGTVSGIHLACQQGRIDATYWEAPDHRKYWSIPTINLIRWARARPNHSKAEPEPVVPRRPRGRPRTKDVAQPKSRRAPAYA